MGEAYEIEVDGLHRTGTGIKGKAPEIGAAGRGLTTGFDSAKVGHPVVTSALSGFVTDHVLDHANKLPIQTESGGINVANVAGVARDSDNDGGKDLSGPVDGTNSYSVRLNRQLPREE